MVEIRPDRNILLYYFALEYIWWLRREPEWWRFRARYLWKKSKPKWEDVR